MKFSRGFLKTLRERLSSLCDQMKPVYTFRRGERADWVRGVRTMGSEHALSYGLGCSLVHPEGPGQISLTGYSSRWAPLHGRETGVTPGKILVTAASRSRRGRPSPESHLGGKSGH